MAAPPEVTLKDLTGKWIMNKTLSDDTDKILQLQGVSWLIRKGISLSTINLDITEYIAPSEDGDKTHIDIIQKATPGGSRTEEKRTLDWTYRPHTDNIFGTVKGRSRWVGVGELDEEWFKQDWEDPEGEKVQSYVISEERGWLANQVWGFEIILEKRYYTRHLIVTKGEEKIEARLVYDFQHR
ncbi:hypothetical protein MMC09_004110 [Bachmanniomyces sp. S44760]|nr:hypothetical protein [Bachmanniomyces sp. S44760]